MEKQIYQALAKAGKKYWWNQGRQYLVTKFFRQYSPSHNHLRILDIGCAAGGTLFYLNCWGDVWGLDISPEAIALCRSWGVAEDRLILGNAEHMREFEDQFFDLVTAVEVIEHLERPHQALQEIRRVLKNDGLLIITVPAEMRLWSDRDERLGHRTRYTLSSLITSVKAEGFEVLRASYTNVFYYWPYRFLLWVRRQRPGKPIPHVQTDTYDVNPMLNWIFVQLLKLETWWILKGGQWPWGVSAVCIARKQTKQTGDV